MRLVMELGHDPDFTQWLSDVTMSIRPKIESLSLPLDKVGNFDTLHQRLHEEVATSKTVVPWLALVGAWCRTRANSIPVLNDSCRLTGDSDLILVTEGLPTIQ